MIQLQRLTTQVKLRLVWAGTLTHAVVLDFRYQAALRPLVEGREGVLAAFLVCDNLQVPDKERDVLGKRCEVVALGQRDEEIVVLYTVLASPPSVCL